MDLIDKVAIVTGSGRGIGKEIALLLAKEECKVVLVARNQTQLEQVRDEILSSGGVAIAMVLDLSVVSNIDILVKTVYDGFGRIDILVNNASILFKTSFLDVTEEEWDVTMSINAKAVFLLSQRVLRVMKVARSGYIVNVSSTVALGTPAYHASYGASKHAVVGISQALYETAKEYGVKVSAIYPGLTDTEMLLEVNPPVPREHWMKPNDVAACVLFLLKQSDRVIIRDLVPWAAGYAKV
ncbi:MAG: SDR family NAD(P)-dependent oxidoreductase [Bacilli bacterium]